MALIQLLNVKKDYIITEKQTGFQGTFKNLLKPAKKTINAVNDISFSIEKGEMVGFIGPNGAGKSTTIKMLTGILVPSAGSISVMGMSPYKDRKQYVSKIGVVFGQKTQLWWDLPLSDTFDLLKKIYNIPKGIFDENIEIFNNILGLDAFKSQPVRQLSLGQRMRADIAAALLHNPEIVFFDEPTIGLDVVAKDKIRQFIRTINQKRKVTMLFTTHDMQDIEKTCDRVVIIDKGSLLYDGGLNEIKNKLGKKRAIVVEFKEHYNNIQIAHVETEILNEMKMRFIFKRDEVQISELISNLTSNYEISDMTIEEPEIEAIVREIYEGGGVYA